MFLPCLPDGLWTELQKMIRGAHTCIITSLPTKTQQECTPLRLPNLTWQPYDCQKCLPSNPGIRGKSSPLVLILRSCELIYLDYDYYSCRNEGRVCVEIFCPLVYIKLTAAGCIR